MGHVERRDGNDLSSRARELSCARGVSERRCFTEIAIFFFLVFNIIPTALLQFYYVWGYFLWYKKREGARGR